MGTGITRDQAEQLLTSSQPAPGRQLATSVLLLFGFAALLYVTFRGKPTPQTNWPGTIIAWTLFAVFIIDRWTRARRNRDVMQRLSRATEAAELNNWDRAGEITCDMLTRPVSPDNARVQALLLLATSSERARTYDVSELLFESILQEKRGDAVQLHQATLGLAAVKLRSEQLTDAVQILDRLRRVELPPMLKAGVELLRLFQEVLMGHHELAAEALEQRRPLFRRYLSTRAGYGYGLLAAAMHALGRADEAAALWRDATLLMNPSVLIERYDLLRTVSERYPASECPI